MGSVPGQKYSYTAQFSKLCSDIQLAQINIDLNWRTSTWLV